jgi:hypothetical protein
MARPFRRPLGATGTNFSDPNWECGRGRPSSLTRRAVAVTLGPANKGGAFFRSSRVGVRADSNTFRWQSDAFLMARLLVCTEAGSTEPRRTTHPRRGFALTAGRAASLLSVCRGARGSRHCPAPSSFRRTGSHGKPRQEEGPGREGISQPGP